MHHDDTDRLLDDILLTLAGYDYRYKPRFSNEPGWLRILIIGEEKRNVQAARTWL